MGSCESTENSGHVENSTETMTEEREEKAKEIVKAVAVVAAGVGLVAWGICKILGAAETSSNRKMMKAPGRDYYIFRDEFERDPASHFRSLRE